MTDMIKSSGTPIKMVPSPATAPPAIDMEHLSHMTLGERGLEIEVLQLFERQAELLLARMREVGPEGVATLAHTLSGSAKGIGGMCYADPGQPSDAAIDEYFGPLLSSPRRKAQLHAYALGLERNALLGVESLLRGWTRPARIVWGTADDIFSAESPDYLARTFGGARGVRKLGGRKLFFPEELPEVIAEEARQLWALA